MDRGPARSHRHRASRFRPGQRVGIAWLRGTCGSCRWCRRGAENLCAGARFTGWDADGGHAPSADLAADRVTGAAVPVT